MSGIWFIELRLLGAACILDIYYNDEIGQNGCRGLSKQV